MLTSPTPFGGAGEAPDSGRQRTCGPGIVRASSCRGPSRLTIPWGALDVGVATEALHSGSRRKSSRSRGAYGLSAGLQAVATHQPAAPKVAVQRDVLGDRFLLPACPVTLANGRTPPGERRSAGLHGNDALWTALWPDGVVVFRPGGSGFVLADGSLQMKFPWWRGVRGPLTVEGRRIDAPAPPLRARIPGGYRDSGFQATGLIFPTPGCWEVTGRAGEASLTFVVMVVKIGEGPVQNGLPPAAAHERGHPAMP